MLLETNCLELVWNPFCRSNRLTGVVVPHVKPVRKHIETGKSVNCSRPASPFPLVCPLSVIRTVGTNSCGTRAWCPPCLPNPCSIGRRACSPLPDEHAVFHCRRATHLLSKDDDTMQTRQCYSFDFLQMTKRRVRHFSRRRRCRRCRNYCCRCCCRRHRRRRRRRRKPDPAAGASLRDEYELWSWARTG